MFGITHRIEVVLLALLALLVAGRSSVAQEVRIRETL